ncbi:unnamed protein product [Nesidiocoris tenuis]|uniref:tRNA (adenine(58)-N(1))-methyltransferase catalytic subunit TRMT61A n=1 Tax=Nesidiocoris tenuis TaxID=355587 RepID=A0A6H5GU08_9HEMI|nr:unnamed protein product [Nesidiocoris tenuis]
MSFSRDKTEIDEGDTVILYLSASNMHAFRVQPTIKNKHGELVENVFQTTYGALKVASLVGVKFGSKVQMSRGWAFVLQPNPELWTLTLPHRTQIIYTADISLIVFHLELRPGSFVVESGTGSGSLTHALARRVGPHGTVRTFDFHDQRAQIATEEFAQHGLSNVVQVACRDVSCDGFGEDVQGRADAVFLDLPHPWLVVHHTVAAFKSDGGRFASFSPCIEQRSQTVASDSSDKLELVCTNYQNTMPGHTGYLTFATLPPVWARNISSSACPSDPDGDDGGSAPVIETAGL